MSLSSDLQDLAAEWGRNPSEAFQLLGEGLRHASEQTEPSSPEGQQKHLSASQLVQGMVEVIVDRCGFMAIPILNEWGLSTPADIGDLTFFLIEHGVLGKQANDHIQDFYCLPDLEELVEHYGRQQLDHSVSGMDRL